MVTKKFQNLLLFVVVQMVFMPVLVFSAPVLDQTVGSYTDGFTDATGISSNSNANVNTTAHQLQLTNASNGFVAPFNSSGYVFTGEIDPTSIVAWSTVTFSAVNTSNTTIKVQFADSNGDLFSDSVFPGNSTGFSTSPIDISGLSPNIIASNGRSGNAKTTRLKLKISFTTSNTSETPTLSDLVVTWTTKQGDLSSTTPSTADWPSPFVTQKSTLHKSSVSSETYHALRWASTQYSGYSMPNPMFVYDGKLITSSWFGSNGIDYLRAFDVDSGSIDWQTLFNGRGYFTIGQNGMGYQTDMTNDIFSAIDMDTGTPSWTYFWGGGHGNDSVIIDDDGTVYTVRNQATGNTMNVYAFYANGNVKWSQDITDTGNSLFPTSMSRASDGTLYFGTYDLDVSFQNTNEGKLYAFDPQSRSVVWSYPTGDLNWYPAPVVDSDGTIYVGNYAGISSVKKIYAINPDGTLKWSKNYGDNTDLGYASMSLRADGVLLATRAKSYDASYSTYTSVVQALSTSDGTLLWSKDQTSAVISFTDGNNKIYASTIDPVSANNWNASTGYFDLSMNSIWKMVWPYTDIVGSDNVSQSFQAIGDDRGWIYGNLVKSQADVDFNPSFANNYIQYFAMAPWTISADGLSGSVLPGASVSFVVTSSMKETNLLLGGSNKVQVLMDNGDKVPLSFSSYDANGDSIWTGSYTIPSSISPGGHTYTVEASQAYFQTDIATHFATAATESGNTGITLVKNYNVTTASVSSGGGGPPVGFNSPLRQPANGYKIIANNGASTTANRVVNLDFVAGEDIKKLMISFTGDFTDSALVDFVPGIQIDLCSKFGGVIKSQNCSNGMYNIYAKLYNQYGVTTNIISTKIFLDAKASNIISLPHPGTNYVLPRNLYFGMTGTDVRLLQKMLLEIPGVYSEGKVTGYFGVLTKKAVQKFQLEYGVLVSSKDVGYGNVGPKTRKKLQEVLNK